MDTTLRFRLLPWFSWVQGDDCLLLISPMRAVRLPGHDISTIFRKLAAELDGQTPLSEVLERLDLPPEIVTDLVSRLFESGVITIDPVQRGSSGLNVLIQNVDEGHIGRLFTDEIERGLSEILGRVQFLTSKFAGSLPIEEMTESWKEGKLFPVPDEWITSDEAEETIAEILKKQWDLVLLVSDAAYPINQFVIAQLLMTQGLPHLVLSFSENYLHLGPLVIPGETACLYCRLKRYMANVNQTTGTLEMGVEVPFGLRSAVANRLVNAALSYVSAELELMKVGVLHAKSLATQWDVGLTPPSVHNERVWKIPFCPLCELATANQMYRQPIALYLPKR